MATTTARASNQGDCARCGAAWTGHNRAHCGACHVTFSGIRLFDRHRVTDRAHGSCLDPATLPGIEFRDGMWREPEMTDDEKARAFGRAA